MNEKTLKFDKQTVMPIVVLVSICIIVAALLGLVNMITAPVIEENAIKKEQEALFEVLPDETKGFTPLTLSGLPSTVKAVYESKSGVGYVVSLATTTAYSSGEMTFVVGIDNNGSIVAAKLNGYYESKDFGKSYPDSFVGKDSVSYADVETVSGVTYSSTAFKDAIGDAFTAINIAKGRSATASVTVDKAVALSAAPDPNAPKTEAQLKELFEALAGSSLNLEDMTPAVESVVKRLYKDKGGKGYFAYLITSTQYVAKETEGLVWIDLNGDIAGIEMLNWTVGHGVNYTEDFLNSFIGKDLWHEDGIELVTEATGTSVNFRNAVFAALKLATADMPRTEKKILELASEMIQNEKGFEKLTLSENAPESIKALYKETSGKGYIAYIVTSTQYVAKETEAIVFINAAGKVVSLKLLTWTVGHGVDYTDDFVNSFTGKTSATLDDGVELVTAATGTSEHLRDAVGAALEEIPTPVLRIVAIIAILLLIGAFVASFIFLRRRRAPYER